MQLDKFEFEQFSPVDFLNIACELNEKLLEFESSSSSVKRTIFGRSYYSTFIFLREILKNNTDYISNPYGEHRRLPNYIRFKGPFDEKTNKELYDSINTLKKLRHQSDYYLKVPSKGTKEYDNWVFEDCDFAINLAFKIIKLFEKHFSNS